MTSLPAGPYRTRTLDNGTAVPYYVIAFNEKGACTSPLTRDHLCNAVKSGSFTHIFLFSHGWNNDWETATNRYDSFMDGFVTMRQELDLPMPTEYRPLLVGVFWPSTALVFGESEVGPGIAAAGRSEAEKQAIDEVTASVGTADAPRVRELLYRDTLNEGEALAGC